MTSNAAKRLKAVGFQQMYAFFCSGSVVLSNIITVCIRTCIRMAAPGIFVFKNSGTRRVPDVLENFHSFLGCLFDEYPSS